MSEGLNYKDAKSVHYFTVNNLDGQPVSLEKYAGHVCIIVNFASECMLTETNFDELNKLYERFSEKKGLKILAFPCNQFLNMEPADSDGIKQFVKSKKVKFDVFEKIRVNGSDGSPLWKYLKMIKGGTLIDTIKWNYTKFIVDKNGQVVERFGPEVDPLEMVESLEKYW